MDNFIVNNTGVVILITFVVVIVVGFVAARFMTPKKPRRGFKD